MKQCKSFSPRFSTGLRPTKIQKIKSQFFLFRMQSWYVKVEQNLTLSSGDNFVTR